METESNAKENELEKWSQTSAENKVSVSNFIAKRNSTDNQNEDVAVKTEIKQDIDQIVDDGYDEIEEKLKQICDGHREERNISNVEKLNSISRNWKGTLEKSLTQLPFHKSINYKYSPRNEIGDILSDNRDNIEIIFGSESGEEFARVPRYTFYNSGTNEIDKRQEQHITNVDSVDSITNNKEVNETCLDYVQVSSRENLHGAANVRSALKKACKQRTREEIINSIKRSVQNASLQDTNSINNSDTSDIVEIENEVKKELNLPEIRRYNKDDATLDTKKFTVKVTGDREDVFDIMQDLFKDTKDFTIQENNNTCLQQEKNNTSVTTIITIDDCPIETNSSTDKCNDDVFSPSRQIASGIPSRGNSDQILLALSNLKNDDCLTTRLLSSHMDEEKDLDLNNAIVNSVIEQSNDTNKTSENEKLQQKVKLQETVIGQLTNQLILLKDLEKKLQNENFMFKLRTKKMEKKMNELNKSPDGTPSSTNCKQMDMRQKLIYDLSNRMNNFEEMNKKLMKTITIECQQKRQLEGQIKQRDKRIKELNWKLEKASKYLERAEKNTNTYKRKMLNMQTFMRRKKLLDGNTSRFHEIMIDSMKEDYSERVLGMSMEIKEICSTNGYKKLLNYGFPLPPLSILQAPSSISENISDASKNNNKIQRAISLKQNTDEHDTHQPIKNDMEVDTKNDVEHATSFCEEIVMDSTETVTGTVQDIFEESNDDVDDFSTNELREHFISQLNAVI
ncbi:PREDICTED: kinesin-like protein KIF27 isoform X2 [Wasmannia auropunctata]|nr:PREDICTED: kinesin-like protein KIF27 isoform X2 [Wasmannia auropunctata]